MGSEMCIRDSNSARKQSNYFTKYLSKEKESKVKKDMAASEKSLSNFRKVIKQKKRVKTREMKKQSGTNINTVTKYGYSSNSKLIPTYKKPKNSNKEVFKSNLSQIGNAETTSYASDYIGFSPANKSTGGLSAFLSRDKGTPQSRRSNRRKSSQIE